MNSEPIESIDFEDIERAQARLDDPTVVKQTPTERSTSLEAMTEADEVHLKLEHLQWTGSFKTRGAYNKIRTWLEDESLDEVVAASAGNHAQGVALAATKLGVDSTIVMPANAPQTKVDATRGYGATVELVGRDFQAAMQYAQELVAETAKKFVHPFDDPAIIAGQGTLGVEMYEDLPNVETVIVPIGGGGLISGIATAFAELKPATRIVGVQADGAATVPASLDKGRAQTIDSVNTIADGIATGGISALTFSIIEDHVDQVLTVTDSEIAEGVLVLMERAKQVVEGAAAASVAAIRSDELDVRGETVMPLLCGGNLDMTMLRAVLIHALTHRKQMLRLRVRIQDKPGKMAELSGIIADHSANIHAVRHDRAVENLNVGEAYLVFEVETTGMAHAQNIIDSIANHGYEVDVVNRVSGDNASF